MNLDHSYAVSVEWTGNRGTGTSAYRAYSRDLLVSAEGKAPIDGSSDHAFFGDATRWNPEDLLVVALSQCHMLSYLHAAAEAGVVVESYRDEATGTMRQDGSGGQFTEVVLHPLVTISAGSPALAFNLHEKAERDCFIATSVNFPVRHEPRILLLDDPRS